MARLNPLLEFGREIFEAERDRRSIKPLTERHALDLSGAYGVQEAYADLVRGTGAHLVGLKIGAANPEIQRTFGLNEPDFGRLFDYMDISRIGVVDLDELIRPHIEPEVAFILSHPLRGPNVSPDDVISATAELRACLEIVDSRIQDYRVTVEDTIADNGSASRFVLGDRIDFLGDLAHLTVQVTNNGALIGGGTGEVVLGGPTHSVAWLANKLAEVGISLQPGHIVLSGSLTAAFPIAIGDVFVAEFGDGASVTCQVK